MFIKFRERLKKFHAFDGIIRPLKSVLAVPGIFLIAHPALAFQINPPIPAGTYHGARTGGSMTIPEIKRLDISKAYAFNGRCQVFFTTPLDNYTGPLNISYADTFHSDGGTLTFSASEISGVFVWGQDSARKLPITIPIELWLGDVENKLPENIVITLSRDDFYAYRGKVKDSVDGAVEALCFDFRSGYGVELSGGPTKPTYDNFTLTAEFPFPVEMLEESDLFYRGVEITDITTSDNQVFTIHVSPNGGEDISIHIPEGATVGLEDSAPHAASNIFALAWSDGNELSEEVEEAVKETVTRLTSSRLRQALARHDAMSKNAADRIGGQSSVPLSYSGNLDVEGSTASTYGSVFGVMDHGGGLRTIVEGELDYTSESDDLRSSSLFLRAAFERDLSAATLAGVYVEGEYAQSDFEGSYSGDQTSYSAFGGAYLAHAFGPALFGHAYAGVGKGWHALDIGDDRFSVKGDYDTTTMEIGAGLVGEYDFGWAVFEPGLSLLHGSTHIGDVSVDGRFLGEKTSGSVEVDTVSMTRAELTPALALPIGLNGSASKTLTFAPEVICERVVASTDVSGCGYGLGVSFNLSGPRLPSVELSWDGEDLNDWTRYSLRGVISHRF